MGQVENDVAVPAEVRCISLFSGVGALSLGVSRAVPGYRTVCNVEREAFPAAVMVERIRDSSLCDAPIWSDVGTFDGIPWRGRVDLITASPPCQPYSVAGSRKGNSDERAMGPELVRIIREVEPAVVFIENVPAYLKHFGPVYDELLGMGFDCAPPAFTTAEEVGAPHVRRRVFILAAHPDRCSVRFGPEWQSPRSPLCLREAEGTELGDDGPSDADAGSAGLPQPERPGASGEDTRTPRSASEHDRDAADTDGDRRESGRVEEHAGVEGASGGESVGRDGDGNVQWAWRSDDRIERIGTGPESWASVSPFCRVDDGPAFRVDRLRAVGNAVVPAQVDFSYRLLAGHFTGRIK